MALGKQNGEFPAKTYSGHRKHPLAPALGVPQVVNVSEGCPYLASHKDVKPIQQSRVPNLATQY